MNHEQVSSMLVPVIEMALAFLRTDPANGYRRAMDHILHESQRFGREHGLPSEIFAVAAGAAFGAEAVGAGLLRVK